MCHLSNLCNLINLGSATQVKMWPMGILIVFGGVEVVFLRIHSPMKFLLLLDRWKYKPGLTEGSIDVVNGGYNMEASDLT